MKNKFLNIIEKSNGKYVQIILDNPPVNALSKSLVQELNLAIDFISNKYQGMIIKSDNYGFSAGADLKERSKMSDEETLIMIKKYKALFKKIESLPFPTIALLNKFALGGGLELSLSMDFRFAVKNCIIGFPETSIGIIPGAGGTQRLTKLVGPSKSKKWIFSARKYTAIDGHKDNIIDEIFESSKEMNTYADNFMLSISKNCALAIQSAKRAINSFDSSSNGYEIEFHEYQKTLKSRVRKKILEKFSK